VDAMSRPDAGHLAHRPGAADRFQLANPAYDSRKRIAGHPAGVDTGCEEILHQLSAQGFSRHRQNQAQITG
jgi:hypothetical protein